MRDNEQGFVNLQHLHKVRRSEGVRRLKSNSFLKQSDAACLLIADTNAEQLAQNALEYGCSALNIRRDTAPSGRQSSYLHVIEDLIVLHIDRGLNAGADVRETSAQLFKAIDGLIEAYNVSVEGLPVFSNAHLN